MTRVSGDLRPMTGDLPDLLGAALRRLAEAVQVLGDPDAPDGAARSEALRILRGAR